VIKAVKKYVGMLKDEVSNEDSLSQEERDKLLSALSKDITGSTKWGDLGFDDLDVVEVLLEVEEEFKHIIPDADADQIQSIEETVKYLVKNAS